MMKPQVKANYLCDKYKRDLITRFNVTPSGKRRTVAIYLSFAGRPCTPERLLWASPEQQFPFMRSGETWLKSKHPNWAAIANEIETWCRKVD
jgi:hypothetical protein|tara:strand:- start:662 stop:937 length:276 start_codon:yes stop_codon:yes gene_type:complete